jgi:formylglycine-generating enzyme required for sulfatase activity
LLKPRRTSFLSKTVFIGIFTFAIFILAACSSCDCGNGNNDARTAGDVPGDDDTFPADDDGASDDDGDDSVLLDDDTDSDDDVDDTTDDDDSDDDTDDDSGDDADDAIDDDVDDDTGADDTSDDTGDDDTEDCLSGQYTGEQSTDAYGITWNTIPAGCFRMGCSINDDTCYFDEVPPHRVNISAFEMTETEITQAQYEAVTGITPSHFPDCPDCPVDTVTWFRAKEFCAAVGGILPTEAQWEYATRAGTVSAYYCGEDAACLEDIAWWLDNSENRTHPVALKDANDFGLYDTLGNVREWVMDWYDPKYYRNSPQDDPQGPPQSPSMGPMRGLRGGSWLITAGYLRVSIRRYSDPISAEFTFGFRCAKDTSN